MKLVSPESLNDSLRDRLAIYSRFFPAGAVCVNVAQGREPWDMRPLALIEGKVHILRVSSQLDESRLRAFIGDLEGFAVIFANSHRVAAMPEGGRFVVIRPFATETLQGQLEKGALPSMDTRRDIARDVIRLVTAMHRRSVTHGHISPSNLIYSNSTLGVVDPLFGALNGTKDQYLPPENVPGSIPEAPADLFGVGGVVKTLLGDSLTREEAEVVHQLLLPSPRHRPPLGDVAQVFSAPSSSVGQGSGNSVTAGRVVRATSRTASVSPAKLDREPQESRALSWIFKLTIAVIAVLIAGQLLIRDYISFDRFIPSILGRVRVDYTAYWTSGSRAKMVAVARAAVLERDSTASDAIIEDVLSGSDPKGVYTRLLRVAMDDTWRSELRPSDVHAALVIALSQLAPEGLKELPPLSSLHPAIIMAIAGHTSPTQANAELKAIPVDTLTRLPAPFGPLFESLKALGFSSLGSSQAISLAAIATGDTRAGAFEGLLSQPQGAQPGDLNRSKGLIALTLPIIRDNSTAAEELLAAIRAQGGELATQASWFQIEDIAGWSAVSPDIQIQIILGVLPSEKLDLAQYTDLLSFPLGTIREQSLKRLKDTGSPAALDKVLLTLASNANQLSREQAVALVASLRAAPNLQGEFISKWFELHPNPDTVVLLLLARSDFDKDDAFNFQAARYLRRATWKAPIDILKLLSNHPEPLARALAYEKLNPTIPEERNALKDRLAKEQDSACLKALMSKLAVLPTSSK